MSTIKNLNLFIRVSRKNIFPWNWRKTTLEVVVQTDEEAKTEVLVLREGDTMEIKGAGQSKTVINVEYKS